MTITLDVQDQLTEFLPRLRIEPMTSGLQIQACPIDLIPQAWMLPGSKGSNQ